MSVLYFTHRHLGKYLLQKGQQTFQRYSPKCFQYLGSKFWLKLSSLFKNFLRLRCVTLGHVCFAWSWKLTSKSASDTWASSAGILSSPHLSQSPPSMLSRERRGSRYHQRPFPAVCRHVIALRAGAQSGVHHFPSWREFGNSGAEVVMWFDLWGCDRREEKGTELSCPDSPVWCGHRSALLTGIAFCHAWGWMTAQGSLAVPFLGPCEVGAGRDGSGGAHHPASQGPSLAL